MTETRDGRRRFSSDRVVVQASVVARLFGIRLLKLDASVLVAPADLIRSSSRILSAVPVRSRVVAAPARLPVKPRSIGAGLDDAKRVIEEGAASRAAPRVR